MNEVDSRSFFEVVVSHADLLRALQTENPMRISEVARTVDRPRRTVRRLLDTLEETDLITASKDGYELTFFGDLATTIYREHQEIYATLADTKELLARLPAGAGIGCEMIDGVEVTVEPAVAPESAWEPVDRAVDAGATVQGLAPRVTRSYIDTFYEQIVEKDTTVELVLPPGVFAAIVASYDREWQAAITAENCWFGSYNSVPPFGMLIIDKAEVWIGVYRDSGSALAGTLRNDSRAAVEWALELYEQCQENAENVVPATDT